MLTSRLQQKRCADTCFFSAEYLFACTFYVRKFCSELNTCRPGLRQHMDPAPLSMPVQRFYLQEKMQYWVHSSVSWYYQPSTLSSCSNFWPYGHNICLKALYLLNVQKFGICECWVGFQWLGPRHQYYLSILVTSRSTKNYAKYCKQIYVNVLNFAMIILATHFSLSWHIVESVWLQFSLFIYIGRPTSSCCWYSTEPG